MLRMRSMPVEENSYYCNTATIYGNANADTIVKKKKGFELWTADGPAVEISLLGMISLAHTWNIVYAYVRKVSCPVCQLVAI